MSKTAPHKGEFRLVVLPNGDVVAPDLTQPLLPAVQALGEADCFSDEVDCVVVNPVLNRTRCLRVPYEVAQLRSFNLPQLIELHQQASSDVVAQDVISTGESDSTCASLLDLKIEIGQRLMRQCDLCEHRCGVNRASGQLGFCRLTDGLDVAGYANLYNEGELVGQPTFGVYVRGCSLRCSFCYREDDLQPKAAGRASPAELAQVLDDAANAGAKSWHFLGGNPDESLLGILQSLRLTESRIPVVWNSALYLSPIGIQLLRDVVDIWLPDFKFGNDQCAKTVAGIHDYTAIIKRNLLSIADQPHVIVRHMSYPGHEQCCEGIVRQWIANRMPQAKTHSLKYYAH